MPRRSKNPLLAGFTHCPDGVWRQIREYTGGATCFSRSPSGVLLGAMRVANRNGKLVCEKLDAVRASQIL